MKFKQTGCEGIDWGQGAVEDNEKTSNLFYEIRKAPNEREILMKHFSSLG